jgi:chemotaxis protein CheX
MREGLVTDAMLTATREVFSTMLGAEVQPGDAYQEKKASGPTDGVVSLIGLAGPWIGTGSVTCSPAVACWMAGALLMTEYDSVNDDVLDAVAEITNMIIGNVKTLLEAELGPMALSIPTVVFGRSFTARSAGSEEWTVFPFQTPHGGLEVKLCLAPAQQHHNLSVQRLTFQVV